MAAITAGRPVDVIFTVFMLDGRWMFLLTGLELVMAKELAERMGRHLFFSSTPNLGSTFGVELPQKIADPAPIGPTTDWWAPIQPAARPVRWPPMICAVYVSCYLNTASP